MAICSILIIWFGWLAICSNASLNVVYHPTSTPLDSVFTLGNKNADDDERILTSNVPKNVTIYSNNKPIVFSAENMFMQTWSDRSKQSVVILDSAFVDCDVRSLSPDPTTQTMLGVPDIDPIKEYASVMDLQFRKSRKGGYMITIKSMQAFQCNYQPDLVLKNHHYSYRDACLICVKGATRMQCTLRYTMI